MKILDLVKLPEELKPIDSEDEVAYRELYYFRQGFNECLSEIRKLNEGVEIRVDEWKISTVILKKWGWWKVNGLKNQQKSPKPLPKSYWRRKSEVF